MPSAFGNLTNTMFHIYPVITFSALYRPEVSGKQQYVALAWFEYYSFRLHPWALLNQNKFTTFIIYTLFIKYNNYLHGEEDLAVKVLMHGIVTACAVF
jgi:hypothetical protein